MDHWISKRHLQEVGDHQDQVCRVTQGNCHTPIILCCRTKVNRCQNYKCKNKEAWFFLEQITLVTSCSRIFSVNCINTQILKDYNIMTL